MKSEGANFPQVLRSLFREMCLGMYADLMKRESKGELPDYKEVTDSVGLGWLYPEWAEWTTTNLTSMSRGSSTLSLLHGVMRKTLSMIIRGEITTCSPGVFQFLMGAFHRAGVQNNPMGSWHNNMYDVYAEIRENEGENLLPALADAGLEYTFQRLIPDGVEACSLLMEDGLWTRISLVFLDLCRRQDQMGWGRLNDGVGKFLNLLTSEQISTLGHIFSKRVLASHDAFPNPLGVKQALLVYASTLEGKAKIGNAERESMRSAFPENLAPIMDRDGDYILDAVSIESVLRAHADPLCPFRLTDRELKKVMQICRNGYIEPVLLSSRAMDFDEFCRLFGQGGGVGREEKNMGIYDTCMVPLGWAGVAGRFIAALKDDLNKRRDSPEVLKKHGRLLNGPVQDWVFLKGEKLTEAIGMGWGEIHLLLGKQLEEYKLMFMRKGADLIENLNPRPEVEF